MQDFERRELEAVLFFALGIRRSVVHSPIVGGSGRTSSRRIRRVSNLGMLQEIGNLRSCRNRIHGKWGLGLVDLIWIVLHRELSGDLPAHA